MQIPTQGISSLGELMAKGFATKRDSIQNALPLRV